MHRESEERIHYLSLRDKKTTVSGIIGALIKKDAWSAGELARHAEQLMREQQVSLVGMERWYARLEWIERQLKRKRVELEDTWGLEPLQSNWDSVCHMLSLYSPIDRTEQEHIRRTKERYAKVATALRVRYRKKKKERMDEVYEVLDLTPEEEAEVRAWQIGQRTQRGHQSTRIYLSNGKTLASRSAAVRHASHRQKMRTTLRVKFPSLTEEDIEKIIDPRGKGYLQLDTEILSPEGKHNYGQLL